MVRLIEVACRCPFVKGLKCNMQRVCCPSCLEVMLEYPTAYQWVDNTLDKAVQYVIADKKSRGERNALPLWIV